MIGGGPRRNTQQIPRKGNLKLRPRDPSVRAGLAVLLDMTKGLITRRRIRFSTTRQIGGAKVLVLRPDFP
jgi:hypothetical protein